MPTHRIVPALVAFVCVSFTTAIADDLTFGFETDKDANRVPDEWRLDKATDPKAVSTDQTVKKSGKAAIRLDDTSEWNYVVVQHMAPVKPNTPYRLKAWAKTQKTTGPTCIYLTEYHAPGKGRGLLKLHILIMGRPREWQEFQKEFTTTEKTGQVRIELCPVGFASMHTGTAWIDDIKLEEAK